MPDRRNRRAELPDRPATAAGASTCCPATSNSAPATGIAEAGPGRRRRRDRRRAAAVRGRFPLRAVARGGARPLLRGSRASRPGQAQSQGDPRLQAAPRRLRRRPARRPTSMSGAPCATAMAAASRCRRPKREESRRHPRSEIARLEAGPSPMPRRASASQACARSSTGWSAGAGVIPYRRPGRHPLQPLRAPAAAERQRGDVLPDGRLRLDGRAREGPGQALLRAAAPVPEAALRPHRDRLHPPHPRGPGSR